MNFGILYFGKLAPELLSAAVMITQKHYFVTRIYLKVKIYDKTFFFEIKTI